MPHTETERLSGIGWSATRLPEPNSVYVVQINGVESLMPSTLKKIEERVQTDWQGWLQWRIPYPLVDVRVIVWRIIACIEEERKVLRRAALVDYKFKQTNVIGDTGPIADYEMRQKLLYCPTICTLIDIIETGRCTSCALPTASYALPTASCALPTASCALPKASYALPTASCALPKPIMISILKHVIKN